MIVRYIGLLCLIFLMPAILSAQESFNFRATIMDAETNEPIPFAHIGIADTPLGTVSNSEGEFAMKLGQQHLEKKLLVSSVGYVTTQVGLDLMVDKFPVIWLERAVVELDPVVVTTLSAKEIVRKAISKIEQNFPDHNFTTEAFYRTASNENGEFVRLLEAGVKVSDDGFQTKNRSVEYLNIRKSKDFRYFRLEEAHLLEDALPFDHVKQQKGFLNPDNLDYWQYSIKSFTQLNQDHVFVIEARFIGSKESVEHTAQIYIADDTYAIVQVDYDYNWHNRHYCQVDSLQVADIQWKGSFHYNRFGEKFYLNYFTFQHIKEVVDKVEKKLVGTLEVYNEYIVQSVDMFPLEHQVAAHKAEDLYAMNVGDTLFWEEFNVPVETEFYQHIIQDLDSLVLQNLK